MYNFVCVCHFTTIRPELRYRQNMFQQEEPTRTPEARAARTKSFHSVVPALGGRTKLFVPPECALTLTHTWHTLMTVMTHFESYIIHC